MQGVNAEVVELDEAVREHLTRVPGSAKAHPGLRHRLHRHLSLPSRGILADLDRKPHRVRGWLTRRDTPDFWDRVVDVCALCCNPPQGAVVLSIDEKTAIAGSQP